MSFNFQLLLSWFFFLNIVLVIPLIILERKRPEKTIGWVLLFLAIPPIAFILYIFVGINWKRHTLNDEKFSPNIKCFLNDSTKNLKSLEYLPLVQLLANNSQSPLFIDNKITLFKDGNEKFNALKKQLLRAKHHIHLEYYIVNSDKIGNEIKDILIKKSHEGVKVRFIVDRVGSSKINKSYIQELRNNGIDIVQYSYFLAPLLKVINTQINYRNHRKIVIIDGKVGFLGGINIGDEYLGKGPLGYWRDTHMMIKGDFVLGLQSVFINDFITIKSANEEYIFSYDDDMSQYFPTPEHYDNEVMQIVKSGPDSKYKSIMQCILKMIMLAKNHIYITTPYFIPPESIMQALKTAALSGIDVKILFPAKYDHLIVYYASRTYLAELLKYGVKIYLYDKESFIHSKVLTIDSCIATIGTANMDIRSYELNYEINAVIYDKKVTQKLDYLFFQDLNNSIEFTIDTYNEIPFKTKLLDAFARLFSSLL